MSKFILMQRRDDPSVQIEVHPDAVEGHVAAGWEKAEAKADPLDHDGDGAPGGSLKGEASTASKGAKRKAKAKK